MHAKGETLRVSPAWEALVSWDARRLLTWHLELRFLGVAAAGDNVQCTGHGHLGVSLLGV